MRERGGGRSKGRVVMMVVKFENETGRNRVRNRREEESVGGGGGEEMQGRKCF